VLTPLQVKVRRIIGELGRQHEFALGGGAALIAYGVSASAGPGGAGLRYRLLIATLFAVSAVAVQGG